jgi:hypothetical protein
MLKWLSATAVVGMALAALPLSTNAAPGGNSAPGGPMAVPVAHLPSFATLHQLCPAGPNTLSAAQACAARIPGARVVGMGSVFVLTGDVEGATSNVVSQATGSANPCEGVGTWDYTITQYVTLNGTLCWNGHTAWNYVGQVGCSSFPIPPTSYCISSKTGALAPAWYSGMWANFSVLSSGVPECLMPRIYDWGNGGWNSNFYWHWGWC